MGLLQDIQTAAIDGKTDLATILRQCKLLAARMDLKPLEDWLLWESGGYPNDVPVPSYRIWSLNLKGHFSGPFGSGLRFAPIPLVSVPEPHCRFYEAFECRQSVSGLESLLAAGPNELHVGTGDLNLLLGSKVYLRMNCLQVWAGFGAGNVVEVLNTVRNKILDFALATGKDYPQAGEPDGQPSTTIDKSQITQIFQTTVHDGGTATFVGAAQNSSVAGVVVPGNLESLRANLTHRGVPDTEVSALADAVQADGQHASDKGIGPKVTVQMRMAEEIENSNRETALKQAALQHEIATLDKGGKDYTLKLKELQNKEKQLIQAHENEITAIKNKAEIERNQRVLAANSAFVESMSSNLTELAMGHKSFAATMDAVGSQIVSGMIHNAIKSILANDMTKESDAAAAARKAFNAGMHFPFPANVVMAPLMGAAAFASVMAFEGGGIVPGTGHGDVVPAALTPGEGIIPNSMMDNLNQAARAALWAVRRT